MGYWNTGLLEYWVREMLRVPLFPGPDLTCSSKDLRFLLLSHYKDTHIPTKSHQGGPTFHSPCLFDPKTLDSDTEVMRFWPLFPGPDLTCLARVPRVELLKYYGDKNMFQPSRARRANIPAFHYSMWMLYKKTTLKDILFQWVIQFPRR